MLDIILQGFSEIPFCQLLPVSNVVENVTVNGETNPLTLSGTVFVTNPTAQNQDTLTLGGSPIFFQTSGTYLIPDLLAFPAGGVGASFTDNLTAKLSIPTGSAPQKPDAQNFLYAGAAISALSLGVAACAIATPCLAFLLSAGATTADVGIITFLTGSLGITMSTLSADPIDLNYMTVAPPAAPVIPALSSTAPATFNDIITLEATANTLTAAMITAFNRAEGAYISDAPDFEQQQLNAFSSYEHLLSQDLIKIGDDFNSLDQMIGSAYPDVIGNNANNLITAAEQFSGVSEPVSSVPEPNSLSILLYGIFVMVVVGGVRRDLKSNACNP